MVSDSGLNPVYKEITIYTSENDILEREECLCLVLSSIQNSNVFFNDNYKAQLCFEDDEGEVDTLHGCNQMNMYFEMSVQY